MTRYSARLSGFTERCHLGEKPSINLNKTAKSFRKIDESHHFICVLLCNCFFTGIASLNLRN